MRIRTIKPEFYTSEDMARLDWHARLVFICLWSYVDDNGVGRDVERLIAAALFPLDSDQRDSLARLSRGLQTLFEHGHITRYTVEDRPYLHVCSWKRHQVIDKPNRDRYPLPTCENAVIRECVASDSRVSRESLGPGVVEKGSSGEREKDKTNTLTAQAPPAPDSFDVFWSEYPKKIGKAEAKRAWTKAIKRASVEAILLGAKRIGHDPNLPEPRFIPNPATWLNQGRWDDDPYPDRQLNEPRKPNATEIRREDARNVVRRMAERESQLNGFFQQPLPQLGASNDPHPDGSVTPPGVRPGL